MRRAVAILLVAAGSAGGAVRINEFVARTSVRLLQRDTNGVFQVGTGTPWMMPSFCDTNWARGVGPFGYGTGYATDLDSTMRGLAMSLYLRYAFTVDGAVAAIADPVQLTISFDPGFVAYLNGREVVRKNLGAPRSFVGRDHPAVCTNWTTGTNATYVLGVASNLLAAGTNVLAIHLCNDLVSSPTFGVSAQLSVTGAAPAVLVQSFDPARHFPGFHEPSGGLIAVPSGTLGTGREWTYLSFDDAEWGSGPGGLGFGDGDDATDLYAQMFDRATSLYLRQVFVVSPSVAASTNALRLIVDYDDGYVAYLNGREIKRAYLGAAGSYVPYDSIATSSHEAGTKVTNTLAAACTLLTPGTNVLAIQVCNRAIDSTDLSMIADLQVTDAPPQWLARHENTWRYYVAETEPPVPAPANDDPLPVTDFADWVELHNDGPAAVSLAGWSLTDDPEAPRRWWFPTHAVVPAGGYALVLCTGTNVVDPDAPFWQADFKLEGSGEYLGLFDGAGAAVSEFSPAYPDRDFFHSCGWDAAAGDGGIPLSRQQRALQGRLRVARGRQQLPAPALQAPGLEQHVVQHLQRRETAVQPLLPIPVRPEPFEIPFTDGRGADRYESLRLRGGHNDIGNPFIMNHGGLDEGDTVAWTEMLNFAKTVNGGALTATNALAELYALKTSLDPTMLYVRGTSVNVANQTNWIAQRPAHMMAHLRQYGLWPNTGPPLFAHPGGSVTIGGNQTVLFRESGVDINAPVLYRGRVWLERR